MRESGTWMRTLHGRRVTDVVLPGDEDVVLANKIRQSIKRDGWLNREETIVYSCTQRRLLYGYCWLDCPYCGQSYYYYITE